MSMHFVGLDLAWSRRNTSGGVALEADDDHAHYIAAQDCLGDDSEIQTFVGEVAGSGPCLVAIDAPLIVPNEEGCRPVDREITRTFGRYGAGCYPAYRNRPGGCTRGEDIVANLAAAGFVHDPYVHSHDAARRVFEVYPHPAMVSLFYLERTLKYKARPNRCRDFRREELARLRDYLRGLENGVPALHGLAGVIDRDLRAVNGANLKRYEDLLDAAVCSYIAYYAWYWGPKGYAVYGDKVHGYILVPLTGWMRERLARQPGAQRHQSA